jgi:tRNA (guanine37-N1)-methyltransferase
MGVPCVRVSRAAGEETRKRLAEADLIAEDFEIDVQDERLFIPVTDAAGVPADLDVIEHDAPTRETQTMPGDLVEFHPSYERVGDIVVVDEDDPLRARRLTDAIVDSALPATAVLNRASKIKGETRVRDWELLAGNTTETIHREYGCAFAVDLDAVYFSPRLATERHRVVEQVAADEHVFDMFAGVGPFVIPAATRGAECVGVDINDLAIEYLRANAARNDVSEAVTAHCGDVRTFVEAGPDADAATDHPRYDGWADRIVMNLPHSADEFLETAVALAGDACTIHYYDIQPESDPFGPGEAAIRAVAEPEYSVSVETRHTVRSYAPHEQNVVLDVALTR